MNWLQYDYRKTGQSQGQSCRFEDLVDDVQGVIGYAKAFLGLQNQDCFLVSEGLGTLIANSVAKRLEGINIVQASKLKTEPLSDRYSFKVFLGWLLGWPAHSYSLILDEKNLPFDREAVCDHLVKDESFS
jgi:alpha/beta superfamily hydrolase